MSAAPIRYTPATMEMMRLEDLSHTRCGVNYLHDHSHGHLDPRVSLTYFANKEWQVKDQRAAQFLTKKRRDKLWREAFEKKVADAKRPPYATCDGGELKFYAHKEARCMAYVSTKSGKSKTRLTGVGIPGSRPCFSRHLKDGRDIVRQAGIRPECKYDKLTRLLRDELLEQGSQRNNSSSACNDENLEPPDLFGYRRPKSADASGRKKNVNNNAGTSAMSTLQNATNVMNVSGVGLANRPKSAGPVSQASSFVDPKRIEECAASVARKVRRLTGSVAASSTGSSYRSADIPSAVRSVASSGLSGLRGDAGTASSNIAASNARSTKSRERPKSARI